MTKKYKWRDMFYTSTWHPHSENAKNNQKEMLEEISRFRELEQKIIDHSNRAKSRFEKKGKRLPRERLALLLDNGRPFLECACNLFGTNVQNLFRSIQRKKNNNLKRKKTNY